MVFMALSKQSRPSASTTSALSALPLVMVSYSHSRCCIRPKVFLADSVKRNLEIFAIVVSSTVDITTITVLITADPATDLPIPMMRMTKTNIIDMTTMGMIDTTMVALDAHTIIWIKTSFLLEPLDTEIQGTSA